MKFWVDLETGTFGNSNNIVHLDYSDWTMNEIDFFMELPDSERVNFALDIIGINNNVYLDWRL